MQRYSSLLRRPAAATGADVTLSAETIQQFAPADRDRALFHTWARQYAQAGGRPSAIPSEATDSKATRTVRQFRIPDASPRLLWRLVRIYRDICSLSANEQGHCFAGNAYFVDVYNRGHVDSRTKDGTFAPASEPTVRRWIATLVEHGWIGSEVCGPKRKLWPLVHPSLLLTFDCLKRFRKEFFARHFERLLTRVLSGLQPVLHMMTDKDPIRNKARADRKNTGKIPPAEPLNEAQRAVVAVALEKYAVDPEWASGFVRQTPKAVQALWDALDTTRCREAAGKIKLSAAGHVRNWAEALLADKRQVPAEVVKMRESEQIAAQKAAQDEAMRERIRAEQAALAARKAEDKQRREQEAEERREHEREERDRVTPAALREPWERVKAALDPRQDVASPLGVPTYETHIRPLLPVWEELAPDGQSPTCVVLAAPSAFHRDWLARRHTGHLSAAWSQALGRKVAIRFVLRGAMPEHSASGDTGGAASRKDPPDCPDVRTHRANAQL